MAGLPLTRAASLPVLQQPLTQQAAPPQCLELPASCSRSPWWRLCCRQPFSLTRRWLRPCRGSLGARPQHQQPASPPSQTLQVVLPRTLPLQLPSHHRQHGWWGQQVFHPLASWPHQPVCSSSSNQHSSSLQPQHPFLPTTSSCSCAAASPQQLTQVRVCQAASAVNNLQPPWRHSGPACLLCLP